MTAATVAESVKTRILNALASTPTALAAVSEPCSARSARPAGLSTRLAARTIAATSVAANTQYQAFSPTTRRPRSEKSGTDMPSGPPVRPTSLLSAIDAMTPSPSVAIAR